MGFSDNIMQEVRTGGGVLLPCTVAEHRMKIFGSAWLEPIDISRVSVKQVLAL
jgi:hypothetical protein